MKRISDKDQSDIIALMVEKIKNNQVLDIKDQLRLVRDRCPDVWDALNSTAKALNYVLKALGGGRNE